MNLTPGNSPTSSEHMAQSDDLGRRAKLLDRFLAGDIDQAAYDRMLAEVEVIEASLAASSETNPEQAPAGGESAGVADFAEVEIVAAAPAIRLIDDHNATAATRKLTGDPRGFAWYSVMAGTLFLQMYVGCTLSVWLMLFLAEVFESAFGHSTGTGVLLVVPLVLIFGMVSLVVGLLQFCSAPRAANVSSYAAIAAALAVVALIVAVVAWLMMLERWTIARLYVVTSFESAWFLGNAVLCSLFFQGVARNLDNRSLRRNARNWMWFVAVTVAAGAIGILAAWFVEASGLVIATAFIVHVALATISQIWLYAVANSTRRAIWKAAMTHDKP